MIDHAMLMYSISEEDILRNWSLETLFIKVIHGFDFELLKRGASKKLYNSSKTEQEKNLTEKEITRLYD